MSIKRQAVSGAWWTSASSLVGIVGLLVQTGILARILSAEDFGLVAMLAMVNAIANSYMDMGISNALIYRQDVTKAQLSSIYWTTLMAGCIVFFSVFSSAPLIAGFFKENRVEDLVRLSAISFIIAPLGQQFQALLQRDLRFSELSRIDMVGSITGVLTAVALGYLEYGAAALVLGQITNVSMRTLLLLNIGLKKWRPQFHFSRRDLAGFLNFGLLQMGEKTANQMSAYMDSLIIGRVLGAEALGAYSLAFQLILLPVVRLNPILTRVAFPIFARKQHEHGLLSQGWIFITKFIAITVVPALVGLALIADIAVPVLLGDGWSMVAVLLAILAPVGIFKSLGNPIGSVLLAIGRVDIGFYWNILILGCNTIAFWFAAERSIVAVAWTYAILTAIYFFLASTIVARLLHMHQRNLILALAKPAVAILVMGIGVVASGWGFQILGINLLSSLISLVCSGALIFILSIILIDWAFIKEIWALLLMPNRKT